MPILPMSLAFQDLILYNQMSCLFWLCIRSVLFLPQPLKYKNCLVCLLNKKYSLYYYRYLFLIKILKISKAKTKVKIEKNFSKFV